MTGPVVAIRPEPGCAATVALGEALGLPMLGHPLFVARARAWDAPAADSFDALLLGSANAVRWAGPQLAEAEAKPVFAVGEATAAAARSAGFTIAAVGQGGLQVVLDRISPPLRLLRLAGEEHVPLVAPTGVQVETHVVYAAEPVAMPRALADLLHGPAVVLLHSAAAARHFGAECDRLGVARAGLRLAALGPRIAAAAGPRWGACHAAREPSEAALLALAADLCHVSAGREGP